MEGRETKAMALQRTMHESNYRPRESIKLLEVLAIAFKKH
jgi:hypothetical protein